MTRYRCPACRRRIRGDRRCHRCGWRRTEGADAPVVAGRPWGRVTAAVALLLVIAAAGVVRMNSAAIADWYARFALHTLPAGFSSFAPVDTPAGAFSHCVSRVAKKVSSSSTVETFPSSSAENTRPLGEGRYSVQGVLEGVNADGERLQRPFTCVVRFDGGRWVTERLAVGEMSDVLLPTALLR
ncbi:MAG TPA: hypothetical protein VHG51_09600 [Longimicrobiaceae bacterium]|nr:hypothetical protein [Longimicrobiaceae bacterium]